MRCEAFQFTEGGFESWCSPTEVYVRVSLEDVSSTAVRTCSRSIPLPDGGSLAFTTYPLEWDFTLSEFSSAVNGPPFSSASSLSMARFITPPNSFGQSTPRGPEWRGSLTFEGRFSSTADAGVGPIGMALQRVNCDGQPQFNAIDLVLALPIRFGR